MTPKELKRLNRSELLQLLLLQTQETERLNEKVAQLEAQLESRQIQLREAGSIAEAALKLNGVMEAAQAAAEQYLSNIAMLEEATKAKCREMEEQTRLTCERMLQQAKAQSDSIPEK